MPGADWGYPDAVDVLDGRYRLGRVVGQGGMATVHEATDLRSDRPVAVKLFRAPHECTPHSSTAERLAAEAAVLSSLSHPRLLAVHDVSTEGDRPYLVMDLVSGETLRSRMDRGPLPLTEVARLGAELAVTLAYVHSRRVVHRDVKPSNILVNDSGEVFLADFGIARVLGTTRLTTTGHFVGTAAYLAPEQVQGTEVGPAADIYALGLVLLECLTGRPEYTGEEVEMAVARLNRDPQVADLPEPWRTVLAAMTARDPATRPDASRCAELLDGCINAAPDIHIAVSADAADAVAVDAAVAVDGSTTRDLPRRDLPRRSPPVPRRSPWRTPRRLIPTGAVFGAAAAAALGLLLSGGEFTPAPADIGTATTPVGPSQLPVMSQIPQTASASIVVVNAPAPAPGASPATENAEKADSGQESKGKARAEERGKGERKGP